MSLTRPNAVITLDGQSYSSAEAALSRLSAWFSVRGSHDFVELKVWRDSKLTAATVGSKLSFAIGDKGSETDAWSGEVTSIESAADSVTISGLAATIALSRTRVVQTYVDQSVADVVRDLAAGVELDQVEGDLNLPAYTIDDRRPVWSHLFDLAALSGAEVGASPSGALRFVAVRTGSADVKLRYGADVLGWQSASRAKPDSASVAAYGAASEAGADQWHWIRRTPSAQGSGPFTRLMPAIRTRDGADAMAQALGGRATRSAMRGRLMLVGHAGIRPGDLVEMTDLPGPDPGTLRVLAVEHRLDARAGFTTALSVEGAT